MGTGKEDWGRCQNPSSTEFHFEGTEAGERPGGGGGQRRTFPGEERSEGPLSDVSPRKRLDSFFTRSLVTLRPGAIEKRGFRGEVAQRCGKRVLAAVNLRPWGRTAGREASKRVEGRPFSSGEGSTLTRPGALVHLSWGGPGRSALVRSTPRKKRWTVRCCHLVARLFQGERGRRDPRSPPWDSLAPSRGKRTVGPSPPCRRFPRKCKVRAESCARALEVGTRQPDWGRCQNPSSTEFHFEGTEAGERPGGGGGQRRTFPGEERSEGPLSDVSPRKRLDSFFTRSLVTPRPGAIETRGFRGEVAQGCGKRVLVAVNLRPQGRTAGREASKRVEGRPFSSGEGSTLTRPGALVHLSWGGPGRSALVRSTPRKKRWTVRCCHLVARVFQGERWRRDPRSPPWDSVAPSRGKRTVGPSPPAGDSLGNAKSEQSPVLVRWRWGHVSLTGAGVRIHPPPSSISRGPRQASVLGWGAASHLPRGGEERGPLV